MKHAFNYLWAAALVTLLYLVILDPRKGIDDTTKQEIIDTIQEYKNKTGVHPAAWLGSLVLFLVAVLLVLVYVL